jgi:hypothetical protein
LFSYSPPEAAGAEVAAGAAVTEADV